MYATVYSLRMCVYLCLNSKRKPSNVYKDVYSSKQAGTRVYLVYINMYTDGYTFTTLFTCLRSCVHVCMCVYVKNFKFQEKALKCI